MKCELQFSPIVSGVETMHSGWADKPSEQQPFENGAALRAADDQHVLLVGGAKRGKGRVSLSPISACGPGSVFCVDPKSESTIFD